MFTEEADKDRYIITYADLITLLLGLFIILYAISTIDVKKYEKVISAMGNVFGSQKKLGIFDNSSSKIEPIEFADLKSKLNSVITENNIEGSIKLIENERGITVRILDDILFPSGSAELNEYSKIILKKIAKVIMNLPNDIRIEGHTDNIPISSSAYQSNWHLSVARAVNTAYYLMNFENLNPDKVSVVGYSEFKPVDTNDTPEGRANNRRVDIVILNK
ncbi:MAG: OmpA family protein [Ignavibacterium sp.]